MLTMQTSQPPTIVHRDRNRGRPRVLKTCHALLTITPYLAHMIQTIVRGKAKAIMDCCWSVTFSVNYEEICALITEVDSNKTPPMTTPIKKPLQFLGASYAYVVCMVKDNPCSAIGQALACVHVCKWLAFSVSRHYFHPPSAKFPYANGSDMSQEWGDCLRWLAGLTVGCHRQFYQPLQSIISCCHYVKMAGAVANGEFIASLQVSGPVHLLPCWCWRYIAM